MCSILAVVSRYEIPNYICKKLPSLLNCTVNRGPDDQGSVFVDRNVYLGSNRLSIIDLSIDGKMPLKSMSGEYWITYNGEIYNYKEIRTELMEKGMRFKNLTDTEVILNAYIYWGEKFVNKLNGIFAFVIYDPKRKKIIASRDRFGTKPLYYGFKNDTVIFSSDFFVLRDLIYTEKDFEVDSSALTSYLNCRFVPGSKTILKNIFKLKPAEIKIWDVNNLKCSSEIFWRPQIDLMKFSQTVFNEKLNNAIDLVATADISPDILLSGGLDSAVIAERLHKIGEKEVKTFTFSFSDQNAQGNTKDSFHNITIPNIDESTFATAVADSFSFKNEIIREDSNISFADFTLMQKMLGEPIASTNAIGNYLFARSLKGKTKLALAGTGSDELLGGYQSLYFKNDKSLSNVSNVEILERFSNFDSGNFSPTKYLNANLINMDYLSDYLRDVMEPFDIKPYANERLNQLAIFELGFALPGWELDQADRLFMGFSIELRPAFLENCFMDYALTISSGEKVNKRPLKKAMSGLLQQGIIDRQKYPGMGTPKGISDTKWFQSTIKKLYRNDFGIWNLRELEKFMSLPAKNLNLDILYRLVYLESWLRI